MELCQLLPGLVLAIWPVHACTAKRYVFSFSMRLDRGAQVGACEEVLVDACQSAGSGGRSLLFTFAITAAQLLPPALMAALPVNSTGTSHAA